MKRPHPSHFELAELVETQAPKLRRGLSEEERALWEAVAKSTKPLKKKPRAVKTTDAPAEKPPAKIKVISIPVKVSAVAIKQVKSEPPRLATLGRRERSQLSRGKKDIEARLDLHGMTQARAHRALLGFLQRASDDGLTFVLVITGKGRTTGPESERGILRRQVPEWLGLPEFRSCVVGFEEAHLGHGGGGALYVRVRRRRF
jgi:DNA-nicking Smr family endonuclease